MNLTDACRLAKNIEGFKMELSNMLGNSNYNVIMTETHLKSKIDAEYQDEVKEVERKKDYDLKVEDILALLDMLMDKKAVLSNAIENAKHNIFVEVNGKKLSYDSAVEYNKSLRNVVLRGMGYLSRCREGIVTSTARGYSLDVEKKQTSYVYTVETDVKLDFNKQDVKAKEKVYKKLADEVSTKIDEAKVTTVIDLDLGIDTSDTLEDIVNTYLANKK